MTSALFGFQLVGFVDPIALLVRAATFSLDPMVYRAVSGFFDGVYAVSPRFADRVTEPVYAVLRHGVLPFRASVFFLSSISLAIVVCIAVLELVERRFWCRNLCPLGALLALFARLSFFRRVPAVSCRDCPQCAPKCRMNAFEPGSGRLDHTECNLCMDCVDDCLNQSPRFSFTRCTDPGPVDLTRRALIGSALAGVLLPWAARVDAKCRLGDPRLLRPPGVAGEEDFLARCVRCGECMKVCIDNGLQPCFLEAGYEGMFSPRLVPRLGYCEYNCTLCGQVCPTGAIPMLALPDKQRAIIGTAVFDRDRCLPYGQGVPCMVCEEHCPTTDKAIRFREGTVVDSRGEEVLVKLPYVREDLCIGCGICENKCPLPGTAAIRVYPAAGSADSTAVGA